MQVPIKNKLDDRELFRIRRMKEVIKTTNPHGHKDYLEIIYLHEGAGTHQIDQFRFDVQPFSLYLILPGQIHQWELTAIPKGFVIMVQKDYLLDHPLYKQLFQTFPLPFPNRFLLDHVAPVITGIFRDIELEYEKKETNHQAVIQTYLLLLFNLLKREIKSSDLLTYPPVLARFFVLLDQHFKTNREVAWYASELGITPKTLNTTCKKYVGKTAGTVIDDKLTAQAKLELLYSFESLSGIADSLGFADASHFNKFFRKQTGVLPGEYRKGIS
ncbi:helix-turn-helix domain-containing protein [Dyadobacter sandarakinus]|uniref:AraC family transcriptional regulator n=1 Tax=Dyadobacter sandarakinus TaxID=2747268 RepID=A0ABX7I6X2_9BACT|nr:helix-turn-helix transcriptional regulator [Dyadobacter sandarakinus]QRR00726.1 AraC family transcriptional regulator [Dyadobacter sandarakinus]